MCYAARGIGELRATTKRKLLSKVSMTMYLCVFELTGSQHLGQPRRFPGSQGENACAIVRSVVRADPVRSQRQTSDSVLTRGGVQSLPQKTLFVSGRGAQVGQKYAHVALGGAWFDASPAPRHIIVLIGYY